VAVPADVRPHPLASPTRAALARYAVAVVASLCALALNLVLVGLVKSNTFPLFFAAVMVGTWFGGLGPGLFASLVTALLNDYFFLSPGHVLRIGDLSEAVRGGLYLTSALLITALGSALRSARQQAEARRVEAQRHAASLRASEDRFRSLLAGVRDFAIVMLDGEGRVASWNAGAYRITGWEEAEIVGQHFSRFFPDDDVAAGAPDRALEDAGRTGRFESQGWRVRKDGSRFWADVVLTAARDGTGVLQGFWDITRDVTERREVEETIRASEARFRRLLEAAPDGMVIVDEHGRIGLVNAQAEALFGYAEAELLGQRVEILLPPAQREAHVGHRRGYFGHPRTRPMGAGLDLWGLRKDGRRFPVEISLSPMQTEDGLLVISAIRDISERREAEARIRALNDDLEQRIADLAALNRELEAFSYSVSHDLRAPLRSIDGFSQALLEDYADKLDDDGRDYLRRVRAATQRMGALIDDLLTLSRVTRREMRREAVDLSGLAQAIAEQLVRTDAGRDVRFTIAPGLRAQGDPHLLRVALENLLGNAWKFTSTRSQARIEFGTTLDGGQTVYFVRDNGVGFDMAYSSKLFGAFQRLHRSSDFPGTGIGLATVQRIITRHGGRVWAEAEVNEGATFSFTLG
jgi:PAS domain S-box-containing protein